MRQVLRCVALFGLLGIAGARAACAIEVKVSAMALERTLRAQLFNGSDGRYYIRGGPTTPCFVYAEGPHVSIEHDRVIVHVHTRAKPGMGRGGACIGVSLAAQADVSLIPEGEGESVGFRD